MATSFATFLADLRDFYYDLNDTKGQRVLMRATNDAVRFAAEVWPMEYFYDRGRINTTEWQDTGTIAITHGAAVAVLSAAASFASTAVGKMIRIAGADYDCEIGTYNGTHTLTFVSSDIWNNTTQTAAAYALYKDRYPLPTDCAKFGRLLDSNLDWGFAYLPSYDDWLKYKAARPHDTGDPAVIASDARYLYIWPPPDQDTAIDFWYLRVPTEVTALGSTMDWPDNLLGALRAIVEPFIEIHKHTIDRATGEAMAQAIIKRRFAREPHYMGPQCVLPMPMGLASASIRMSDSVSSET